MRLKKLELQGFKSFRERTPITFQPGVTAVVGPNGCGKSNISDAILWVLGEQSAKTLRGQRMEDVIFNGTNNHKPVGFAEVSLTLGGTNNELDSSFGEYQEITVSRRLFRTGESEYMINKIPCRLKDIRDLLIDTGAGVRGHTVIEQGKVDQILQASPIQRREIIEETAGITKYKIRKTEAVRKLDATEQNLLRVRDIISEVKKQINSLDRQAKKTAQYQTLREELKTLEIAYAHGDYLKQGNALKEISQTHNEIQNAKEDKTVRLQTIEASVESQRIAQSEQEEKLKKLQQSLHDMNAQIQRAEGGVELAQAQIHTWGEQEIQIHDEIKTLENQTSNLIEESRSLEEESGKMGQELETEKSNLQSVEENVHQQEGELKKVQEFLEEERSAHLQSISEITQIKNQIAHHESRKIELNRNIEKLFKGKDELSQEQLTLLHNFDEKKSGCQSLEGKKEALTREDLEVRQTLEEVEDKLKKITQELHEKKDALTLKKSRLHSIEELHKSLAGYQEGTQALIKQAEETSQPVKILANSIEVTPSYEKAIEAALGERIQAIQTQASHEIQKAVNYLKESSAGRATFMFSPDNARKQKILNLPSSPGILGYAIDHIKAEEPLKTSLEAILHDVVIVDSLQTALSLRFEEGIEATFVTKEGDMVESYGIVTGGSPIQASAGPLQQKREIQDLKQEISECEYKTKSVSTLQEEITQKVEDLTKHQKSLEQRLREIEIEYLNYEKDLDSLQQDLDRTERNQGILTSEEEISKQDHLSIDASLKDLQEQLNHFLDQQRNQEIDIKSIQNNVNLLQEALSTASEALTLNKVKTSTLKERYEHALANLQRTQSSIEQYQQQLQQKRTSLTDLSEKKLTSRKEQESLEKQIQIFAEDRNELKGTLLSEEQVQSSTRESLESSELQLRELRKALEETSQQLLESDLKLIELRIKQEHLRSTLLEEYSVDLETLPPPGPAPAEEAPDPTRISELKNKLEQMGPVNLMAIQEYQELDERFQFLTQQENDLSQAIDSLRQTIQKIHQTTSRLFQETFTKVNEKFGLVFSSFFEGGKAELVLVKEEDTSEPGVEIVAQPPGKRLRNLSLLSGGERALTAISLLFATFLIHPSPFCILDEIDAPLDEENVRRFTKVLLQMTEHSQFIVITHNKKTMEIANVLYGVTMEETGISKLVSVKMEKKVEDQNKVMKESPVNA